MRIALAQLNYTVGDINGNADQICNALVEAAANQSDIAIFSELAICGYPPEDLLLRPDLHRLIDAALERIALACGSLYAVVGHPVCKGSVIFNAASVFHQGECVGTYHKQCLPNYSVFDEKRYFEAGSRDLVVPIRGVNVGVVVCEDLWFAEPVANAKAAGAQLIVSPNASPYHYGQVDLRYGQVRERSKNNDLPIIYVNQIGGQDELVFDGRSMAFNRGGELVHQSAAFAPALDYLEFSVSSMRLESTDYRLPEIEREEDVYQALTLGVGDYIRKNGFPGVLLGMSGGIDSALTAAIAADAIGAENVHGVMMPFRYTAQMSVDDAAAQADALGMQFDIVPIEEIYNAFMGELSPLFGDTSADTTEQNLQARSRGTLLMALSNKSGKLVLTTGNKSEMAVGYATLYGDMAGGFDVLKDVPKMLVYALAKYRNTLGRVIPERVITRAPSAELAPDQKDEDNLPPYPVLDAILEAYVVKDHSIAEMVAAGFAEEVVRKVVRLVDINEHKRRQAAPGVRISKRAFGRDRRYPITSGFGKQFS